MTAKEVKTEFARWIDERQPKVWVKDLRTDSWGTCCTPYWQFYSEYAYIIDDKYAELRKALFDGKTIQREDSNGCWVDIPKDFDLYLEDIAKLRIKPTKLK